VGAFNLLPSCGFATLSLRLLVQDLRAGWIRTHWRQVRSARALRGRYDLVVAVGDIVVIAAARLTRSPFVFVGCAKSSYYAFMSGYTRLEKRLLRRHCLLTFPRDRLTVAELERAGVRNEYAGNPMMDDLEGDGETFGLGGDIEVLGLLPGSRLDMERNAVHLLEVLARCRPSPGGRGVCGLFAPPDRFDTDGLVRVLGDGSGWRVEDAEPHDARRGIVLRLRHGAGAGALFVKGKFADVIRRSRVVVGTAGTANEQAVGLGRPLITFPTAGVMGKRYVKMKMQFFGSAARRVSPEPQAVAAAVDDLLRDRELRERMAAAGRERMGDPGASERIASRLEKFLESPVQAP